MVDGAAVSLKVRPAASYPDFRNHVPDKKASVPAGTSAVSVQFYSTVQAPRTVFLTPDSVRTWDIYFFKDFFFQKFFQNF